MILKAKTRFEKTVRSTYFLVVFVGSVFFLKFNILFGTSEYNNFILPPLILAILTPIINLKFKSTITMAWYIYFTGILTAYCNILVAGGVLAPGVFWVAVVPLAGGLLIGEKGAMVGTLVTAIFIAALFYLDQSYSLPNVAVKYSNYTSEKNFNIILFSAVMAYFTIFFVRSQYEVHSELKKQKQQFEGLLGMLIHDIAGPLTVIKASARIAKQNPTKVNEKLGKIESHCEHLVTLINGIREMKAVADQKLDLKLTPVCLTELIEQTVEFFQERAEQKGVFLNLDLPKKNEVFFMADSAVFKSSILGNLIANAIKFSEKGKSIEIRVFSSHNKLIIEVADQGIGIPHDLIEKLFSPHAATSRPGTDGEKGTGYGLILVKQWSEAMSGTVEVTSNTENRNGQTTGTIFRLSFPRIQDMKNIKAA